MEILRHRHLSEALPSPTIKQLFYNHNVKLPRVLMWVLIEQLSRKPLVSYFSCCAAPGPNNETNSCFMNVKWARVWAVVIVKHDSDMREVRTREWTSATLYFSCCAHQASAIRGTNTNNNWNTTSQGLKACSLCCPVYFRLVIGSRGVIVRY